MIPSPALEVAGLAKHFGDVLALDGCSFSAQPGRVLGLLGPNDAGKTTAMRCVFGLIRPDAGQVRWDGADRPRRPAAVVLDEPFAGLDPIGVEALSEVIAELAADGAAVVFSSHQLDLVEHVCQDVVVIDHGRVALEGELERLRAASDRRYLSVGFRGNGRWKPAFGDARVLEAEPGRTRLELNGAADLETLVRLARSAGEVTHFSLEPPALSDPFRKVVAR